MESQQAIVCVHFGSTIKRFISSIKKIKENDDLIFYLDSKGLVIYYGDCNQQVLLRIKRKNMHKYKYLSNQDYEAYSIELGVFERGIQTITSIKEAMLCMVFCSRSMTVTDNISSINSSTGSLGLIDEITRLGKLADNDRMRYNFDIQSNLRTAQHVKIVATEITNRITKTKKDNSEAQFAMKGENIVLNVNNVNISLFGSSDGENNKEFSSKISIKCIKLISELKSLINGGLLHFYAEDKGNKDIYLFVEMQLGQHGKIYIHFQCQR